MGIRLPIVLLVSLVVCSSCATKGSATIASAGQPPEHQPFCSSSRGPLSESEANGVSDATLCPPPGHFGGRCLQADDSLGMCPDGAANGCSPWACLYSAPHRWAKWK